MEKNASSIVAGVLQTLSAQFDNGCESDLVSALEASLSAESSQGTLHYRKCKLFLKGENDEISCRIEAVNDTGDDIVLLKAQWDIAIPTITNLMWSYEASINSLDWAIRIIRIILSKSPEMLAGLQTRDTEPARTIKDLLKN